MYGYSPGLVRRAVPGGVHPDQVAARVHGSAETREGVNLQILLCHCQNVAASKQTYRYEHLLPVEAHRAGVDVEPDEHLTLGAIQPQDDLMRTNNAVMFSSGHKNGVMIKQEFSKLVRPGRFDEASLART